MNCDWTKENTVLYIYGELADDAKFEFEQHVRQCLGCRRELETAIEVKDSMAAAPVKEVSPSFLAANRMQLQEALEMINRGGMILLLSLVQEARFEMSQGRMRIGFESFFKTVERPFIVKRVNAAFAGQKMGLLLLIELALARGQAAAEQKAT